MATRWTRAAEIGSNVSDVFGLFGLDEVKAALKEFADQASDEMLEQGTRAAAEVFREAVIAATPVGKRDYSYYSKKKQRQILRFGGQAKRSVIIYKRKVRGLTTSGQSLLVGYSKDAFYMYFYEMGRQYQPERRFMRDVFDATHETAMEAAKLVVSVRLMAAADKVAAPARRGL